MYFHAYTNIHLQLCIFFPKIQRHLYTKTETAVASNERALSNDSSMNQCVYWAAYRSKDDSQTVSPLGSLPSVSF